MSSDILFTNTSYNMMHNLGRVSLESGGQLNGYTYKNLNARATTNSNSPQLYDPVRDYVGVAIGANPICKFCMSN